MLVIAEYSNGTVIKKTFTYTLDVDTTIFLNTLHWAQYDGWSDGRQHLEGHIQQCEING